MGETAVRGGSKNQHLKEVEAKGFSKSRRRRAKCSCQREQGARTGRFLPWKGLNNGTMEKKRDEPSAGASTSTSQVGCQNNRGRTATGNEVGAKSQPKVRSRTEDSGGRQKRNKVGKSQVDSRRPPIVGAHVR